MRPLVTVLIPARNELEDIDRCLSQVVAQDYPLDRLEILVVDGGSTDGTGDRVRTVLEATPYVRWKVLHNAAGTTPSNLNHGLAIAQGEIVCRIDARSLVPTNYVRVCVDVLTERPDVVVVGGAQVALAREPGAVAQGIARALNNRYGMGLARYRRGAGSGPTDTVYLGAFRTAQLRGARGWDERMLTNQDFELNRRLGRDGVVWFDERLEVGYVPRRHVVDLLRQYHRFGRWKVRYWRETGDRPVARQWVLLAIPPAAGVALAWGARRRSRLAVLGVVGAGGMAAIEVVGSNRPATPDPAAHAVAAVAMVAVATGWLSGVGREAVTGWRNRSRPR